MADLRELDAEAVASALDDPAEAAEVTARLNELEPPALLSILERLEGRDASRVLRLVHKDLAEEIFDALDPGQQADIVEGLSAAEMHAFLSSLKPDDQAELIHELPRPLARAVLHRLPKEQRDATSVLLGYRAGSLGRHMSPQAAKVFVDQDLDAALEHLLERIEQYETIHSAAVLDADQRVVGIVDLATLVARHRHEPRLSVTDVMTKPMTARTSDDAEEVARWFLQLELPALPVVDADDRLVGVLTPDDAVEVVHAADEEDQARAGGLEPLHRPYLASSIRKVVRSRVVWLLVLGVSAILTVQVLELFEATLEQVVVLALFIPLLTGTGGNTGNQAATTVTRALATGEASTKDLVRIAWREARTGALLGAILGVLGFGLAWWAYGLPIGSVIGLTLLSVCTMAAVVGGVMPLLAKLVRADPAVFSNPFISTFCDATGLIVYFLIARAVLGL